MREKKINLIFHSIASLLLTLIFAISTAFGWYTQNKVVSANGINGVTSIGNLTSTSALYAPKVDEDGNLLPPEQGDNLNDGNATGFLSGDVVYYVVKLHSLNDVVKDLTLKIQSLEGSEWITMPPQETLESESDYTESTGTYTYMQLVNVDGQYKYQEAEANLYMDANGEFYFTELDGVTYKNYIYEDASSRRYNMLDVYSIRLKTIYITDDKNNSIVYEDSFEELITDGHLTDNDIKKKWLASSQHGKTIDVFDLLVFNNWGVDDHHHDITFIFEIKFDIPEDLLEAIENGLVSMNSMSVRSLSFQGMLVIGEDK